MSRDDDTDSISKQMHEHWKNNKQKQVMITLYKGAMTLLDALSNPDRGDGDRPLGANSKSKFTGPEIGLVDNMIGLMTQAHATMVCHNILHTDGYSESDTRRLCIAA